MVQGGHQVGRWSDWNATDQSTATVGQAMATPTQSTKKSRYHVTTQNEVERAERHRSLTSKSRHLRDEARPTMGLQLWPEDIVGFPIRLTRTALFGLPRRGRRQWFKEELVVSGLDTEVFYTGEQLDQKDLEVWLMLLMAFQGQDEDYMLRTRMSYMLKTLNRNTKGHSRIALTSSLKRLASASVYIKYRDGAVEGVFNFLHGIAWDTKTQEVVLKLGRDLGRLFDVTAFIDFEKHVSLPSQMTKAVHKYAVGNKRGKPHAIPLNKLKKVLGYEGEVREFRKALIKAFAILESAGVLREARIIDGMARWSLCKL